MRLPAIASLIAVVFAAPAPAQDSPAEITEKSQKSVEKATRWILKNQNRNGSWGLDVKGTSECITCTSLCALALMAAGNHERGGPDRESVDAVRSALEFVLTKARQKPKDIAHGATTLVQNKLGHKVHTFFAIVFLTQAYGMRGRWVPREHLEEMREVLSDMVTSVASSQESDGSWHKEMFGSLKATAMAWLALRSASSAGIEIKNAAVDKIVAFMKKAQNPSTGHFDRCFGNNAWGGYQTIYADASALRVLYGMGDGASAETKKGAEAMIKSVGRNGPMSTQFLTVEGEDYLCSAMMTQAMMIEGGKLWAQWFPFVRDELIKRQSNDGTWTGTACISGKTFATACAVLTLTTPYRLLPLYEN